VSLERAVSRHGSRSRYQRFGKSLPDLVNEFTDGTVMFAAG